MEVQNYFRQLAEDYYNKSFDKLSKGEINEFSEKLKEIILSEYEKRRGQ